MAEMMNFRITEEDNLDALFKTGESNISEALDEEIGGFMDDLETVMSQEGTPVEYPINWDYPGQGPMVIRKLRAAGNLPYRRTGTLSAGWQQVRQPQQFILLNPVVYSQDVYGRAAGGSWEQGGQSSIFENRWPNFSIAIGNLWNGFISRLDEIKNKLASRFR